MEEHKCEFETNMEGEEIYQFFSGRFWAEPDFLGGTTYFIGDLKIYTCKICRKYFVRIENKEAVADLDFIDRWNKIAEDREVKK